MRLILDFPSKEKLAEWFENLKSSDATFAVGVGIYEADALDLNRVTPKYTYVMSRDKDRPVDTRLVLTEIIERVI